MALAKNQAYIHTRNHRQRGEAVALDRISLSAGTEQGAIR